MPTYDYACAACGHRFEVIHGVHASGPDACPICGQSPVRKVVVAPSFVFKGSGWAKLDRRTSATPAQAKDASDDAAKPAPAPSTDSASPPPATDKPSSAPTTTTTGSD